MGPTRRLNEEKLSPLNAFELEREQLNQLLADARLPSQAPSEVAPSEANEVGTLEDLADDDEAWGKVEKSKRKAYLNRGRDKLAKDLRSSLSSFAKVSDISSPFKKTKV